ncbi:WXG100 family type VII secretion target [Motilibacter rhizosphaerae]|uniref:ESAT-6-like protein n=1 Tax=Motilibacter rhizosphaerae TaxID=598652 RepID=A0A4Q7NQH7_9ACTN|nr:WXG100 family type VII secretion target [Motilibacter rhizosphaerae]RZS87595.1 WXG100 family type VII secretion target [Motilibacter rhizosphaerae]
MTNLNVTYDQMRTAATSLRTGQADIETTLTRLKGLVDTLVSDGYTTDGSSVAFQSSYEEFTTGAKNVIEGLTGMGAYLTGAADTFDAADRQLAAALKR